MPKNTVFLSPEEIGMEKYLAFKKASFKISDLALAASGTVSLELAANRTPMVACGSGSVRCQFNSTGSYM